MSFIPIVIALPVQNEEAHIASCIDSLIAQTLPFTRLVLLLNNCTDATPGICAQRQKDNANIEIVNVTLPPEKASAGEARRLAWQHAALFAERGVILTTDADAQPDPTWIARNVSALADGADAVCGMAALHPADAAAICHGVHFDELRERFFLSLLDEIAARVDPDPVDPWPRHQQHSGASIALTGSLFDKVGGAPCVPSGEDRALIERLRRFDARIRHAPDICVHVSGRLEGRAAGGMAATIKRRSFSLDVMTDDALEPAIDAYRRVLARARLRNVFAGDRGDDALASDLLIEPGAMRAALDTEYFGTAWDNVQTASPVLRRRRLAFAELARETRFALGLHEEICKNRAAEPAALRRSARNAAR